MAIFSKKVYNDKRRRYSFAKTEIFFECCYLLDQSQFTNSLPYFFFKRRTQHTFATKIKNRCVISGYSRAVSSNLRMSRRTIIRQILAGGLPGYYRAV
jgi:ribosomal protein S14